MKREISVNSPWRVIIVGGGFGGLRAAQALKSDLFDVTIVAITIFISLFLVKLRPVHCRPHRFPPHCEAC